MNEETDSGFVMVSKASNLGLNPILRSSEMKTF